MDTRKLASDRQHTIATVLDTLALIINTIQFDVRVKNPVHIGGSQSIYVLRYLL